MAEHNKISDLENNPEIMCKYGSNCYQTNKKHLEKYKHPDVTKQEDADSVGRQAKRHKPNLTTENNSKNRDDEKMVSSESLNNKEMRAKEDPTSTSEGNKLRASDEKIVSSESLNNKEMRVKEDPTSTSEGNKLRASDAKQLELKENLREQISELFLCEMPDDFYSFWEMCESLDKSDPANALKSIKLKLVGPFDVLAGKVVEVYEEDLPKFLRHWRYYYDPPEFQTVLASKDARCFHIGYYRDDPKEMPVFVASNMVNLKNQEKNGELKVMGENLFAALNAYLEELKTDPFSRMKVPKFQKTVTAWAKDKGFSLEKSTKRMESRNRKVVAKTFHGAGIVVPVDKKNDVGYRELTASNSMLKKILKGIVESKFEDERKKFWEQLQPVITFANIANDECDFGTTLELGLDLFTFGSPLLHRVAKQLLTTSYSLLGRPEFAKIIEAHLEDRKEGSDLSVL